MDEHIRLLVLSSGMTDCVAFAEFQKALNGRSVPT